MSKPDKHFSNGGIKSRERVHKHGEVFTPAWLVSNMCDMLQIENPEFYAFRIDSTFLEPSCGTGNFIVEILKRKFERCEDVSDGIVAIQSIYGIDIMMDNVEETRSRMRQMFVDKFSVCPETVDEILNRNIICGNFLTKLDTEGHKIWFLD